MSMVCNPATSVGMSTRLANLSIASSDDQLYSKSETSMEMASHTKEKTEKGAATYTTFPKLATLPDYSKANEINKEILKKERSKYYERKTANARAEKSALEHDAFILRTTGKPNPHRPIAKPKVYRKKRPVAYLPQIVSDGSDQRHGGDSKEEEDSTKGQPADVLKPIPKLASVDASSLDGIPVVDETYRQKLLKFPQRSSKGIPTPVIKDEPFTPYEMLCLHQRRNVIPGLEKPVTLSWTKAVYNKDVFDNRYPETDEFRYQRDSLSTWVEQSVIRRRMMKAWKEHHERWLAARSEGIAPE